MIRVLHLPTGLGGRWALAQAERQLGLDSKVLIKWHNVFTYEYDICLHWEKKSIFGIFISMLKTFLEIRNKYDVFHFNFGSTLVDTAKLSLLDLPFYRGVKIMTYNGCDARQKYPTMSRTDFSACHEKECYGGQCNSGFLDKQRRIRIKKAQKYVNQMFAVTPDLMYFLPEEKTQFLPQCPAGWYHIEPQPYKIDKRLKIVHAPTERGAKGTKYIIKSLERLKSKYKNIEIILIENVPYRRALEIYKEAHLVIDQVLIGWYGNVAIEAMRMGKPVAVFIREADLKFVPQDMAKDVKETVININPFNMESVLSKYIKNPELLYEKSKASLEYVHRWHDPIHIAKITKATYEKFLDSKR